MFKEQDWINRVNGLEETRELLKTYPSKKDAVLLEESLWHIWRFAEYALNAGLELIDKRSDRGHNLGHTAEILYRENLLSADHSKLLEQLELYRQKVEYGSFARKKSVHFNASNVNDCLVCIQQIQEDLEVHLRRRGKLS